MAPLEIRKRLNAFPFQPFRVHLSDGTHYDVRHPDFMLVTQTRISIALAPVIDDVPTRSIDCDPIHITRMEPLLNGAKPGKRKAKRRR